jgi:thiol-disulfide isomerase/thioredoxin
MEVLNTRYKQAQKFCHYFHEGKNMSVVTVVVIVIVTLFIFLVTVPRIFLGISSAKLKDKPAPTLHAGSAARIKSGQKTVLYFFTPPCGACKMQEPIIERVEKNFPSAIFKIDASRNSESASAYGVMGVPFLVFIDKGVIVSAKAGVQPETSLNQFLS